MITTYSLTADFILSLHYLTSYDSQEFVMNRQYMIDIIEGEDAPFEVRNKILKQELDRRSAHLN